MVEIPKTVPPIPPETTYRRDVPAPAAMAWLRAGWADFKNKPATSLL